MNGLFCLQQEFAAAFYWNQFIKQKNHQIRVIKQAAIEKFENYKEKVFGVYIPLD